MHNHGNIFDGLVTNERTYPDVVIETDDLRIVVEMKTNMWTGFQPSQPNAYLTDLKNHSAKHTGLIVLVPRHHSHKRTIEEKIATHRTTSQERQPCSHSVHW